MKKHIILTILAAAGALLASCTSFEPVEIPGNGFTLSLDSGSMTTKADGEVSFEDVITGFDYFFFDDEDGAVPTAGMHGHVDGASITLQTGLGQDFEALRTGTHYVYILANYPVALTHSGGDYKLEDLLGMKIESDLVKSADDEGNVTFASSLVMDSYDPATGKYLVELTPKKIQEERTETVKLSRVAVKLSFTINVAEKVEGTMGDTWKPLTDYIQAYFVNALNNMTLVSGEPVRRADPDPLAGPDLEYYTYPTNYPVGGQDLTFTSGPYYTYPQTWNIEDNGEPYLKIYLPWISDIRGTSDFYYKVVLPEQKDEKWTLDRNCWYNVTVNLSVVDTATDYIEVDGKYTIHPWSGSTDPGSSPISSARFFDVPTKEYHLYSQDDIKVPFSSSSAVSAYFTQITYTYYGASNGVLATYVFDYTKDDNKTDFVLPGQDTSDPPQTVVAKAKDPNSYKLAVENKNVVFTHALNEVYTERTITFVIENLEGRSETVTVIQHPAIEIKTHTTKNGFVNGWFARATKDVKDGDGNLMGVGPYTATHFGGGEYYHASTYWYENSSGPRIGENANTLGIGILYGDCTTSVHADCLFDTEVTVSAFTEDNNSYTIKYTGTGAGTYTRHFRIGDPRVPANTVSGFSLPDYLYSDKVHRDPATDEQTTGSANDMRAWQSPLEILIANQNASANEVIAPRFLVSSNFNNMSSWPLSNANCVRRAATYQENGYPAGRWRLPTEAEINFMMTLQQKGIIPELYAFGSSYQCANGRAITIASDGTRTSVDPKAAYVRFVYDLWYWGDEQMDPDVYHPNMHLVAPNQN